MPVPSLAPPLPRPRSGWRSLLRHGVQVGLANVVIAGLLASTRGGEFGRTLVYAQCIGLPIWLLTEIGRVLLPPGPGGWPAGWRGIALVAVSCAAGYAIGSTVADAIFGLSHWREVLARPEILLGELAPTVIFCVVVAGAYYLAGQSRGHRERAAAAAHEATLARLTLLQSQLEPHMLFNTLANLRALIGADPGRAQEMLDRLIDFLRATLAASRTASHPLASEFARLDDYLALMRIRMGARLDAQTALPHELATLDVPPLLLQPLVENAIKHGLEPQRGPGTLHVSAARDGRTLVLAVVDSGRGIEAARAAAAEPGNASSGFGLVQVRERLHTLYGDAASFTLVPAEPRGTRAEIRLPLPDATSPPSP